MHPTNGVNVRSNHSYGSVRDINFSREFPDKYYQEIMDYIAMEPEHFLELCDRFRFRHLVRKVGGEWNVRHSVWEAEREQ